MRKIARFALTLAAASLGPVLGCGPQPAARQPRAPVTVAVAVDRAMPFELVSTGTVEAIQTAAVGSQVGGVIKRIGFRDGSEVTQGQILFELDPRPFRDALRQAESDLARDGAQAEMARLDADRNRSLFQQEVISQEEWDQSRTADDASRATLRADSAAVQSARLNLVYASIHAPITGRAGAALMTVGDYVKPETADPLVTINQIRPVRVRFTIPASAVSLVLRYRAAQPRVVVTPSGADTSAFEGRLVFVNNTVDPSSGTLLLKGEFPNRDGSLEPGEFVDVRLILFVQSHATVVPAAAVTNGQQGSYVYVLAPDSTVSLRNVTVDRKIGEQTVVGAGLRPGETVVTDGQLRLSAAAKVTVRSSPGGAL